MVTGEHPDMVSTHNSLIQVAEVFPVNVTTCQVATPSASDVNTFHAVAPPLTLKVSILTISVMVNPLV